MEEWKECKLGDLCIDNKGSYGIAASAVPYSENLYTYLRITDINDDGTLNKSDLKSVADENAEQYILQPNDIVFARTGGSTGRNYFYDGSDGVFVYAGFLIKFSIDPSKVNPKYIKYFCLSQEYKNWVYSFNTGSTRGNINAQTYANMPVILPPRSQQDLLVKTLSSLDDKIELNNKINTNLEQQTQALFEEMFYDDEKNTLLGEVIETTSGGTPSRKNMSFYSNGNNCWVKSKELESGFIIDTEEKITDDAINSSAAKLLPENSVLIAMYGATVGAYGIISTPMTCNQAICVLIPNENYPYTYLFMFAKNVTQELENLAVGSAQQNISQVLIKKLKVHSDTNKIKEFHSSSNSLFEQMLLIKQENKTLSELRDSLLPKLMNGEIEMSSV